MHFTHFSFLIFFGALAIFIYGIRLTRTGVQLLAGDRLRVILARMTENRFRALASGIIVTLILQSSNATTISLVGFAANGTMSLVQAIGIMLGADIGSTLVVLLLSIEQLAQASLLLLIVGILVDLMRRSRRASYFSMLFMGFGFIFLGMKLMSLGTEPLQQQAWLQQVFAYLADRPILIFLASILFTVGVQNSAAPIGLAIALSFSGMINLEIAFPIVLGANIGTCSGSIFASLNSNNAGKQTALAHLMIKSFGATLAFLFFHPFLNAVVWVGQLIDPNIPVSGQIALSHLLFNLCLVLLWIPWIKWLAWLVQKVLPKPRYDKNEKFRSLYLDKKSLEMPSLAFANVRREMLRMLDLVREMFRDCLVVLERNDRILMEAVQSEDDQVDLLDREIKLYLAKLSQENLTEDQAEMELRLVTMTSTLEEIGDVVNRNILELAEKKMRKARRFSPEGWKELAEFHGRVLESFQLASASLTMEDDGLARKLLRHHDSLQQLEREGRQGHLYRLHQGLKESLETSSIHLDLLSNFYRVNYLLHNLIRQAYPDLRN